MNGHAINITSASSSPRHHMQLAKGTSMQTMTTAISNIDEESRRHGIDDDDTAHHPRRRQTSSSTNNGGSKRSYQSSSTFYEQSNRPGIRKPSEDRVPQASNPSAFALSSDHGAYDNPMSTSSRSPTPTSSTASPEWTVRRPWSQREPTIPISSCATTWCCESWTPRAEEQRQLESARRSMLRKRPLKFEKTI